jgi:bifunctional enzyme CysN/CysC
MATGASNADLALVLIDARKGVLSQTRRHSFILSLIGVKHVVLVVNKIDLVDYDQQVFDRILAEYQAFAEPLGFKTLAAIPVSALRGDNIIALSEQTPWYTGAPLVRYLEDINVTADRTGEKFRFPVQWVNRPNLDFRGFSGTISAGDIAVGDEVLVASSRKPAVVSRIVTMGGELSHAVAGQAVTIVLDREVEVSRGEVLSRPGETPEYSNQFQARIVWMNEEPAFAGRSYLLKIGGQLVPAAITDIKFRTNVNTLEQVAANKIQLNEVATVTLATDKPIAFDAYTANATTGGFILVDRLSNATLAAGAIDFGLRRAQNLTYQSFDVNRAVRAQLKGQEPRIVWFTGLSGSGKSSIANLLEKRLTAEGRHAYILDGDNVRHGLNKDLGFTEAARVENIRRVSEVAKLMADAGLIVLVSFISPFENERRLAREIAGDIDFTEVYVDTPIDVCEARDPKGLYKKARAGEIKNFTGLDSPFEVPSQPELVLHGAEAETADLAEQLYSFLKQ